MRVTRLRKGSNCAGVQRCQVCAPINRERNRDREKTEKERGKKMKEEREETTRGGRRRKREKKKQGSHVHQRWHVRVGVTVLLIFSQENAIWNTWVP